MKKIYSICMTDIREEDLKLQETIFHNANGYLGVRATLEEGYPEGVSTMRGMYVNGLYDIAPMSQAEKLCNLIEDKETMINVTDTQTIQVGFEGQMFSMLDSGVKQCRRTLDMEKGITSRSVQWEMASGQSVDFTIMRMASFEEESLFTIDYEVSSEDFEGEMTICSLQKGLVSNYFNPKDPRLAGESHNHLQKGGAEIAGEISTLESETITSKLKVAVSVAHRVYLNGKECVQPELGYNEERYCAWLSMKLSLHPGDKIRIIKYTVIRDSVREQNCFEEAKRRMERVLQRGVEFYYTKQAEYLKKFWENSDMQIWGDGDLNASVCFNMYQLLQSAGRDGRCSIAAKGLSGEGYEGHYFWDTEIFMIPYFTLTNPELAKKLLEYRYTSLPKAKENATLLGHKKGALYPWRTITGRECSGYFPSGSAQYHINGDIVYAFVLYYKTSGDWDFIKKKGLEVLLETARLWMDVGTWYEGKFQINCVTGPDEYTCMVNNNYYTNACARYNLEWLLRFARKFQEEKEWMIFSGRLQITEEEIALMQQAAEAMYLPYDEKLGINPQDDSFLKKPIWDFEGTPPEHYPLLLHYHPLHLYRYQVCKQADTVLAQFLFPEYQDKENVRRSFRYYEKITTHDSSLSTCVFSMAASRLGLYREAYAYFGDSAKLDLLNTHKNSEDGIHAANMGGCYMAIVYGFAGLRAEEERLFLAPYLPDAWQKYSFRICYQGRRLQICVDSEKCEIILLNGKDLSICLYGKETILCKGQNVISRNTKL